METCSSSMPSKPADWAVVASNTASCSVCLQSHGVEGLPQKNNQQLGKRTDIVYQVCSSRAGGQKFLTSHAPIGDELFSSFLFLLLSSSFLSHSLLSLSHSLLSLSLIFSLSLSPSLSLLAYDLSIYLPALDLAKCAGYETCAPPCQNAVPATNAPATKSARCSSHVSKQQPARPTVPQCCALLRLSQNSHAHENKVLRLPHNLHLTLRK